MSLYATLKSLKLLNWSVLNAGYERRLFDKNHISDYATNLLTLDKSIDNREIILLASADYIEQSEVKNFLDKLSHLESDDFTMKKIQLGLLCDLNESDLLDDEQKIEKLQGIYADLEYPENMQACSIYSACDSDPIQAMSMLINRLKEDLQENSGDLA